MLYDWSMDSNHSTTIFMNSADKNEMVPKPARLPPPTPPQPPPAGGKSAEAGRIHSPRQIASPCLVRISSFNHLDFARNSFELCPTDTASWENRWDGREAEGGSLENYYRSNPIEGSNPSPTAKFYI